jgi:hypothetical protein
MAFINDEQVFTAEALTGTVTQMSFQYKPQTGSSWSTFGTDNFAPWESEWDMGMVTDGYYHIRVWAENCAGMGSYSDWITVWVDRTSPRAVITDVNGMDVENNNDPYLDLTDYNEATVTASFFDDQFDAGNSGISKVAFYLLDSATANVVRVLFVDPADEGSHSATFDISGLTEGTAYYFTARAFDNAGNWADSGPVYWRKFDTTAPIVAIAGYMSGTLYAVDWSGDATSVLFERQDGDEWVGIGIGTEQGSSGIWMADWVPEAGQEYTLRVISGDGDGNYDDENVLTAEFTMDEDGIVDFGTNGLSALVKKNNSSSDIQGILRAVSPNGSPVVLAVYSDASPELISVDQNQQDETMFHGSFDASGNIYPYGTAMFFVSHPNTAFDAIEIDYTAIVAHEIHPDFGTNGYVQALDSMVQLNVMGDAVNNMWSAIIMESWIPEAGIYQDHFRVVPNPNGNAWYIGCDDDWNKAPENGDKSGLDEIAQNGYHCCFNDNVPGVIRLPYDPDEESQPGDMAVAWWDPSQNEWRFDGILFPAYVEGFNTEDNYVEFATECLFGLYAVVSYRDLPQGPVTIDLLGKSYCGYYPTIPEFKLSVVDRFSEIDTDSWNIMLDDMYLVEQGDEADFIDIDFDEVSNLLFITYEDDYDGPNVDLDPLTCGAHTLTVGVKNNQGAYTEEAFDIMVDCAPPQVVFENSYVSKNPTIEFWVTDEMSGVDTSSIHVDVMAVQTTDTNVFNPNQWEELFFLQTFFPGQITIGEDGYVSIPTTFELEDERAIVVVIYDGYRTDDYNEADPIASDDYDQYYHDDHGIHDCVGNAQTPVIQILAIDVDAPSLTMVGEDELPMALNGCVKLRVMDDGGGIEADDITIYEDGLPIERVAPGEEEEGVYSYNENTGIIHYCVTPGVDIDIVLEDDAGNTTTFSFGTGDPNVIVDASLTYNPWDPTDDGVLTISYDFTGSSEVKIYDFGGDLVWSRMSSNGSVTWNGNTMDGTRVAKGVYFAHIIANASEGTYSTVVKIAIVDK